MVGRRSARGHSRTSGTVSRPTETLLRLPREGTLGALQNTGEPNPQQDTASSQEELGAYLLAPRMRAALGVDPEMMTSSTEAIP